MKVEEQQLAPSPASTLTSTSKEQGQFDDLSDVLTNFYLFAGQPSRSLVRVLGAGAIRQSSSPVVAAVANAPLQECTFFLCNDVLLVGFAEENDGRFTIGAWFELADLRMETYASTLRLSQNDTLHWEFEFVNGEILNAFCIVLADTQAKWRQVLLNDLYASIPESQARIADCKSIEVFKRLSSTHTPQTQSAATLQKSSRLAYIWKQIQNVHDFTLQTDYDKAIDAALSASLSLANIAGSQELQQQEKTGISQLLSARVQTLFSLISTELAKASQCSKSRLTLQLKRLIRLGFAANARSLLLEGREERLKLKVNQIPFKGDICEYISQVSSTTFSAIKACIQVYTGIFPQNEYCHLVAWCDTCLLALVVKVRRHLLECQGNSFASICDAFKICLEHSLQMLEGTGVFLTPFLQNYLVPDVLSLISKQEPRIKRIIQQSTNPEMGDIKSQINALCVDERTTFLLKQVFGEKQPSAGLFEVFFECQQLIDGVCLLFDEESEFIRFLVQVLVSIGNFQLQFFAEQFACNMEQQLRDLCIWSANILPSFQLQLEGKALAKFPSFTQLQQQVTDWLLLEAYPKARAFILTETTEALHICYSHSTTEQFDAKEAKRPSKPIMHFCASLEEFWPLDKPAIAHELLLQLKYTEMQFDSRGLHAFLRDLFQLGEVAGGFEEGIAEAIYFSFDLYKSALDFPSPLLDREWTDEQLFTLLPTLYKE